MQRLTTLVHLVIAHLFLPISLATAEDRPSIQIGSFVQEVPEHFDASRQPPVPSIDQVWVADDGAVHVRTHTAVYVLRDQRWNGIDAQPPSVVELSSLDRDLKIRETCRSKDGKVAVATDRGLFEKTSKEPWQQLQVFDSLGRQWAVADVRCVAYDAAGRLWFGSLAGVGCRDTGGWKFWTGHEGLPYNDFTCSAASINGSVWFGTKRGAIRMLDGKFHYRQGPRWLPGDDVRDIAIDRDGNVLLATDGGLGWIANPTMTLAEKANRYEKEIEEILKRTAFGYVANAHLKTVGDRKTAELHDNDNDGLWTAMYGAGECFVYAVHRDESSKRRADHAFRALKFLQEVTQGGNPSPPPGYVARSILPMNGRDPNLGQLQRDRKTQASGDNLWKVLDPRWPKSADGKWYWKGDTSSDELDGHYFFHALYYDLVAQTEVEKREVAKVVTALTDHLIDHHFQLIDHDGKTTRWGNFSPTSLNSDFRWFAERGLNSMSMLAYLAIAAHMAPDGRYEQFAEMLRRDHSYAMNLMVPKIQRGIGSGNQSDDEMAFMSFYHLVRYTRDPELRRMYLASFHWYWTLEQPERNPFFHFAYAAVGDQQSFHDNHDRYDLSPWGDWLEDAADTLKAFPLDRVMWPHQNSHRLDLILLPPQQAVSYLEKNQGNRGYRIDGKVLPVDERSFAHWNTDPWNLDYRDGGHELASGTVFLLPYYMGLYHGYIRE